MKSPTWPQALPLQQPENTSDAMTAGFGCATCRCKILERDRASLMCQSCTTEMFTRRTIALAFFRRHGRAGRWVRSGRLADHPAARFDVAP